MKILWKLVKVVIVSCVFFSVFYILVSWILTRPVGLDKGSAGILTLSGKVVGAINVGQTFTKNIYFQRRPFCAGDGYDASSSAGSNRGPTSEEYLAEVEVRIDTFLLHHPYLQRKEIPAEMVTASTSGPDPDTTPASVYTQVKRVAEARGTDEATVRGIVDETAEKPLLGLSGAMKMNVLKLNVALEKINGKQ